MMHHELRYLPYRRQARSRNSNQTRLVDAPQRTSQNDMTLSPLLRKVVVC